MSKNLLFIFLSLFYFSTLQSFGQPADLKFKPGRKFRILQFTDVHFNGESKQSDSTLSLISQITQAEKPDLMVLTGDIVTSKQTLKDWETLSNSIESLKVPWAIVLGNHDIEGGLTGKQIMEILSKKPYSITKAGSEKLSGTGNYILTIKASASSKTAAILYFLDSHSGFKPKTDRGTYEWIAHDQISWYRAQSAHLTKKNGGTPYPALAFFHIPFPEYKEVVGLPTTIGSQVEKISSPDVNTGMYAALLESKDVMATFVGHDHNDNFAGCLRNICLVYGESSGRQGYGDIGKGARVIDLYEGQRKFDTWIIKWIDGDRDKNNWTPSTNRNPQYFVTYPDSFQKK